MNIEDRIKDALEAYEAVDPSSLPAQAPSFQKTDRLRRGRPMLIALTVVLSIGGILSVRLLSEPRGVLVVNPSTEPSIEISPSSSPSPSLTSAPYPVQIGDKIRYTSADGTLEILYPKEWRGPTEPMQVWTVRSQYAIPQPGHAAPDGATRMEFSIHTLREPATLEDLLQEDCEDHGDLNEIFESKKVEINGWTWTWCLQYSEVEWNLMLFTLRTIVDDRLYNAFGIVWGDRNYNHEPQLRVLREIAQSMVLHA